MPHDIQAIKGEFVRLLNEDTKEAIVALLTPMLHSKESLSADDTGWAFWNICDNYAMLRKAREQYACQAEFYEWSKSALPSLRHHWVVSDATQAMTIIDGGFLDFWWNCYYSANESAPQVAENRAARFESHRANATAYTHFREFRRAETALLALEAVLSEDPLWANRGFAKVTFTTLRLEFYDAQGLSEKAGKYVKNLERDLKEWLQRCQKSATFSGISLLGSWEQLNATRPPGAIFIAIHNAACAFVVAKYFIEAERWFEIVLSEDQGGMTDYSKALYLLACWNNRHNESEIHDLLHKFQDLPIPQVLKFAPELRKVLDA
jgi:hypothetical protein